MRRDVLRQPTTRSQAALFCLTILLSTPALADVTGRATVIDGDTLEIRGERIRLWGVDAPETGQTCANASRQMYRCGQRAALALSNWLGARPVACRELDRDRYGRSVSRCAVGNEDLGGWLVRRGLALDYRQFSGGAYATAEAQARAAKQGLWVGRFTEPSVRRRENGEREGGSRRAPGMAPTRRSEAVPSRATSPKGERIYHAPGMASYVDTQISTARGELWFCSEGEARAAGWRAPRNRR